MTDKSFKQDAKTLIDSMFETKMFNSNITRDDMNDFENYIEFVLKSNFEVYIRMMELAKKLEKYEKRD